MGICPDVIIKTDGGTGIGLGHLTRCFALAQMLKNFFRVQFLCEEIPQGISQKIELAGFQLTRIHPQTDWTASLKTGTVIVLDGYQYTGSFENSLRERNFKVVTIDDLHDRSYNSDLIINHSPGVQLTDYHATNTTNFALGPDYGLLRPAFLGRIEKGVGEKKEENIIICFGGSDIKNLTKQAVLEAMKNNRFSEINVVTGESYLFEKSIHELSRIDKRIKYYQSADEEQMACLFEDNKYAIVPASGVLLEAISMRCKTLTGKYVNNQHVLLEGFTKLGVVLNGNDFNENALREGIVELLSDDVPSPIVFDGKSGVRLLKKICPLYLSLRFVKNEDRDLLFDWINEEAVRNNSITGGLIIKADHDRWFETKINSDSTTLYILEFAGVAAGQVRFDKELQYYIIDYSIAKEYRGLGFGSFIIEEGMKKLEGEKFIAKVKKANTASQNIFRKLGFKTGNEELIAGEYYQIYTSVNERYTN